MKKVKFITIFLSVIAIIFLIFYVCEILIIGGKISFPVNYENINKIFEKDKENLFVVSNYFEKIYYKKIYISTSMQKGTMSIDGVHEYIQVPEIIQAIEDLKRKGYSVIGKSGNTIFFQKWSNLDSGRGIAYSVDGKQPQLEFLVKYKLLSEDNWYYYEEDVNEWKKINEKSNIPKEILGVWNIKYAKTRGAGTAGEDYSLRDLYGIAIDEYGGTLTFNDDGTFTRYIGITTDETDSYEGTYYLHYGKIKMKYYDGTERTAEYMPKNQEMVYYTWDSSGKAINEFYQK